MSYPTATTSQPSSFSVDAGESGSDTAVAGLDVTTKARMVRRTLSRVGEPYNQGGFLAQDRRSGYRKLDGKQHHLRGRLEKDLRVLGAALFECNTLP